MVILVDMDGVLADFEYERFKRLRDRGLHALPPTQVRDFYGIESYREAFGSSGVRQARAIVSEPGFFRSMRPVAGAIEGVQRLVDMGHDVRVCSKPLRSNPRCADEKLGWLEEHLGTEWADRAIITDRKSEADGHWLIDDRPDLLDYMSKRKEPMPRWGHVLFSQPWNAHSTGHDLLMLHWGDFDWLMSP